MGPRTKSIEEVVLVRRAMKVLSQRDDRGGTGGKGRRSAVYSDAREQVVCMVCVCVFIHDSML
jgi:hypothetical protein